MEPTATNANGDKIVYRGGQWVPMDSAPQFPGVVQGRPKPPPAPDPIQDRRDEIGLNRDEIGLQKDRIALEKLQAETAAGELSSKLGKEAGFYLRARSAGEAFNALDVGPESQRRAAAGSVLPENWINQFTPEERQKAETFMEDFIAASLRYESGAAIGQDEFDRQARIYFPQPGDSQGTLEAKRKLRENMIESLGMGAGPEAVTEVDRYLAGLATQGTMSEDDTLPEAGADEEGLQGGISYEGETYEQRRDRILAEADRTQAEQAFGKVGGTIDDAATLGKQGISLGLSDEAAGLGGALSGIFNGEGIVGGYTSARDQERARIDIARENLGGVGTAIEVAGGGAGILARPGQVMAAGRRVAASGQPISRPAVQNVLARQAGADGARIGAVGGFGYGEGLEGSAINTAGGAVLGGALGYGGQRLGNALANRATPRRDASDLARAGQAEGVTVNRAMADPNSNNAVTKSDASIVGGRRVQRDMEAIEGQFEGRVDNLGRGGTAMLDNATGGVDRIAVGDKVRGAGERFIAKSGKAAKAKYDRAEKLAGDAKITPKDSVAAVDDMIAKLSETPDTFQQEIAYLQGIRGDLSRDLSVGGLRRMRTALRKKISKGDLVYGEDEARVKEILDVAADDIRAGLTAQGRTQAARAFDTADKAYRARMDYIENTVQKMLGRRQDNLPAETVAKRFESMSSNDARGLRKFYATLTPEERADVAATFAETLGRNNKDGFTVTQFLRQTTKLSDETARTLFGPEGAQSIQNLRKIGREVERVTGAMNSRTSKSGVASFRDWMWSLMAGGGGAFVGGIEAAAAAGGVAGVTAANQIFTARALMSPKIQKWILQTPKTTNPKAIDAHFNRLGEIAKAEPALAGEIEILRKGILGAANDNTGRLAAENQNAEEGQ